MLGHFEMGRTAGDIIRHPIDARLETMRHQLAGSRTFDDLQTERRVTREGKGPFSFEMFVLRRL